MEIIFSIPSGQRTKQLIDLIYKWRKLCDFKIAVSTWCDETAKEVESLVDYFWYGNQRESFAFFHNNMANVIRDWDVFICGADDCYPGNAISKIEIICKKYPDKVIWVRDGFLDQQPTHPIITRKWYEKYGNIFDEKFKHNFCDSDLFVRTCVSGEIVKCFDISFDHRHYLKTNRKKDDIYKIGEMTYAEDSRYFNSKHEGTKKIDLNDIPEIRV